MALRVYKFSELVSNLATAMQASTTAALNFTPGSVLRAICEAVSGVILWLQAIILQLLTLTRAATSKGADLDTWMADFNLTRLASVAATGQVTFSRFTATQRAVIPVGVIVQTADGTQRFIVLLDVANGAYSSSDGGYVLPANTSSLALPVGSTAAGSGGNVLAGSITVLSTPIPGVDTVSNGAAFTNGIDAESDAAFRSRFFLYIASLSRGTKTAVKYAVSSTRQGLASTITENEDYDGTPDDGYFYVVVDDFTGYPTTELLTNIYNAIEEVRPLTSRFSVFAPIVLAANVAMTLSTAPNYAHPTVVANVNAALTDFINAIPLGSGLPYTQLASIAYGVAGVVNASGILLNGGTSDLAANKKTKVLAGTMTTA